ncbi:MAG: NHL repeat-containing protein [Dehalococcoidia bacterium]|nr:NHL repeat-containing protein [Dehalococcoidia bacterium]
MLTQVVAGRVYDYSHNVGRSAAGGGMGFANPQSAALGADGVLYVVNRGSETISGAGWNRTGTGVRVSRCTIGTEAGDEEYLGEFSTYGDGDGEFIWGSGIAADGQGNVYITDEWLDRITIFDKDGNFLANWNVLDGSEDDPYGASGLAMDSDENLYVAGGRKHQVRKFTKDGRLLSSWGSYGAGQGQLDSPWGITVDHQGCVYVADHRNHRVQKFSADGAWIAQFGGVTGPGKLYYPTGVAVDPEGDVYVSDWSNNGMEPGRVHIFDPAGVFLTSLIGDAQQLSKWAMMTVEANVDLIKARRRVRSTEPEWRFSVPTGVFFDKGNGRLVVMDTQRGRLQIYNKLKEYLEPQFNL